MAKSKNKVKEIQLVLGSPQETQPNSMTIIFKPFFLAWRPNNYRRQILIKQSSDSGCIGNEGTIPSFPLEIKRKYKKKVTIGGRNKLISIKEFRKNITLQLGTKTLTAIYSQEKEKGKKIVYLIKGKNKDDVLEWIKKRKEVIRKRLEEALITFAKENKIYLPLVKPIWTRYEDFIKGEEYIDSLPKDLVVYGITFKKVYTEGIEFINYKDEEPTDSIKNYIDNQAMLQDKDVKTILGGMDYKINRIMGEFMATIETRNKIDRELAINLKAHIEAVQQIGKGFKRFNKLLSQKKLEEWF